MDTNQQEQAMAVADWLNSRDGVVDGSAVPVIVKIGRVEWPGAAYQSKTEGAVAVGDIRLYIVGPQPKSYLRSSRTLYVEPDGQVWYFGGWYDDSQPGAAWHQPDWDTKWRRFYHPFGSNAQFHRQTADGFPPVRDWYRGDYRNRPTRQLHITRIPKDTNTCYKCGSSSTADNSLNWDAKSDTVTCDRCRA